VEAVNKLLAEKAPEFRKLVDEKKIQLLPSPDPLKL
jgi:hypothetical protein